ncbi:MAG: pyridoxamine 5'-phosphate oxidase [Pseudomonadales bacterium]
MKDQRDNRRDYTAPSLHRSTLAADPLDQFERWFRDAVDADVKDATAMALATAAADGTPAVRIVLLKHFDAEGFCWYTDYRSAKGRDLAENPRASCLFHWHEFERQVRLSGTVEKLSAAASEEYFASRPADSRFSAAASCQSAPIENRAALETKVAELRQRFPDGAVPKPGQWGGYRLKPHSYEFWQGREGRLHDRFRYRRISAGGRSSAGPWVIERLQP